jgi:hypothetical protein
VNGEVRADDVRAGDMRIGLDQRCGDGVVSVCAAVLVLSGELGVS